MCFRSIKEAFTLRLYQPIWLALKTNGVAQLHLSGNRAVHWKRITKAVIQEKWLDPDTHKEVWRKKKIRYHWIPDAGGKSGTLLFDLSYLPGDLITGDF